MKLRVIMLGLLVPTVIGFLALALNSIIHADCRFAVRVTGRVVGGSDAAPIRAAYVMSFPARSDAEDEVVVASSRQEIDDWDAFVAEETAAGGSPPDPSLAPGGGGAAVGADGTFSYVLTVYWSYGSIGGCAQGPRRPPPRHDVGSPTH